MKNQFKKALITATLAKIIVEFASFIVKMLLS